MNPIKSIVIVLIIMLIPRVTWSRGNDKLFVDALSTAGAAPHMMDISDWSVINREYIDFSQMEQYRDQVLNIFGAKQEFFKSTKENSEMYRILHIEGMLDSDTFLQIIIQSVILPEEYEKEPQTYLVVNVSGQNLEKYVDFAEKVQKSVISLEASQKLPLVLPGPLMVN